MMIRQKGILHRLGSIRAKIPTLNSPHVRMNFSVTTPISTPCDNYRGVFYWLDDEGKKLHFDWLMGLVVVS